MKDKIIKQLKEMGIEVADGGKVRKCDIIAALEKIEAMDPDAMVNFVFRNHQVKLGTIKHELQKIEYDLKKKLTPAQDYKEVLDAVKTTVESLNNLTDNIDLEISGYEGTKKSAAAKVK